MLCCFIPDLIRELLLENILMIILSSLTKAKEGIALI
jgi:hypothetical protein